MMKAKDPLLLFRPNGSWSHAMLSTASLYGKARLQGDKVDMGAYEYILVTSLLQVAGSTLAILLMK